MSGFAQDQFLDVIDRDEAERRFRAALELSPLDAEEVPLCELLGRILAQDVIAPVDVPFFDRSDVDGYAVRAADLYGCSEEQPARLRLIGDSIAPGRPRSLLTLVSGAAVAVATGAVVPRGADAVVMVEHTDLDGDTLLVRRPLAPGAGVTFAGTDIGRGETVLRQGELLTSRETGVLAALGLASASVVRRPRVAILSTGDELIAAGKPMDLGLVYDSNAVILADAVRELGAEPVSLGIIPDDRPRLEAAVRDALQYDVVLLSGGTSKGLGDLSYRVVNSLGTPGILAHGIALKPGKPLCLAAIDIEGRRPVPVAVLPGFPTSAVFTFREFVAPVIRKLAGCPEAETAVVRARMPFRVNSERGRTEYLLVSLVLRAGESQESGNRSQESESTLLAYPMGKGSGSVTTFSCADGFVVIPRQKEFLDAGEEVNVHRLSHADAPLADLIVIGSHCTGLDYLLGILAREGIRSKFLAAGSTGGLTAARRGECDLAGIHLLDPASGIYNQPFLGDDLELIPGYGRLQAIVFRPGDGRFEGRTPADAVAGVLADAACVMVNRNRGSGTRFLIDRLLAGAEPPGYWTEARSHNAVVAAVVQGRADWGVSLASLGRQSGLGALPLQEEQYDFVTPRMRCQRRAVAAFRALLRRSDTRKGLREMGFLLP